MAGRSEMVGRRPPPPSLYRSPAAEQAMQDIYSRALASLPYAHEERLVPTATFGTAHVLVCGDECAPPLVVWHGFGAPGPSMLRMFDPLIQGGHFRLYLPDIPYHGGGRSEPIVLDPAKHEYGQWCLEVLQGLALVGAGTGTDIDTGPGLGAGAGAASGPGITATANGAPPLPPCHVGVSYGGAVLLDLAVVAPQAIRAAGLVVPGGLVPFGGVRLLLLLQLPALLYYLLPCRWTGRLALAGMCDEPEDAGFEFITAGFRHVCRYPPLPGGRSGFTPEQLRHLTAPTFVIGAEHDIFGRGADTAAAARCALPGCRTMVVPGARHIMSKQRTAGIMQCLLDFFGEQQERAAVPQPAAGPD